MAFESTKRELGELFAFVQLLADGQVSMGRADGSAVRPVSNAGDDVPKYGQRRVIMVERELALEMKCVKAMRLRADKTD